MSWGSPQRPRGWAPPYGYGGSPGWGGGPPQGFRPPGFGGSPGQQRPQYGGWGHGFGVSIVCHINLLDS